MKKILVVDDDKDILDSLSTILEMLGYDTQTTTKGDETFLKIDTFKPDLIILDVLLAGKDGRHICKQLKTEEKTKHIPIIMISAHPGANKSANEAGADDFVAKPFDITVLLEKVKKYI
jgi:DNA-binding response OmpR family regulator